MGHYLMHRALAQASDEGLLCTSDEIAGGDINGRDIEKEANAFAAALLMPSDSPEATALQGCARSSV